MALREIANHEGISRSHEYLRRIGRPDLESKLTSLTPAMYISPEYALNNIGPNHEKLAAAGGLGVLSADHVLQASLTGLPFDAIGIYHTRRMKPSIDGSNWQQDICTDAPTPQELGLQKQEGLDVVIAANGDRIKLDVYDLAIGGNTTVHLLHERGLREVYPGQPKDDHRLYQMAVLGFGGWQVVQQLKKVPEVLHLNESSTSLTAVAMWDSAMQKHLDQGMFPSEAFEISLQEVRNKTILTNHTLVPAAEAEYAQKQYDDYVMKNITNPLIKQRIKDLVAFNGGKMRILDLGMYLAGKFNGVSQLHARLATDRFQKMYGHTLDGNRPMEFKGVTNAIDYRWFDRMHEVYRENGIMDEYDLPGPGYAEKIAAMDNGTLRTEKDSAKRELRDFLKTRELGNNETGHDGRRKVLELPVDAVVIGWARRFAGYKRPGMMLEDMAKIKGLLEKYANVHIVYAGKTHPTDEPMKRELQRILNLVQNDKILKDRVHFVQDYDIEAGKKLTAGADIWVNTPIVGEEACGTSIFKAVANNSLLVSTPDGGAADVEPDNYLAVVGPDELKSLYEKLDQGLTLVLDTDRWAQMAKKQLTAFMPIICGGRMIGDYLDFSIPQSVSEPVSA